MSDLYKNICSFRSLLTGQQSLSVVSQILWAFNTTSGKSRSSWKMAEHRGNIRCCFVVCFVFFLSFRLSYGVLYSSADQMVLLENDTISSVIHNSPSAWIVEFYSSFCGHCHAFAPTWKKLAKMAKGES